MNEKPSIIYFANLKNSKTYKNDIYLFEQMSFFNSYQTIFVI